LEEKKFEENPIFTTPDNEKSPRDYFTYYFDNSLLDLIVHETNLYSVQKNGKSLDVTPEEITAFFGILIWVCANFQALKITGLVPQEYRKSQMSCLEGDSRIFIHIFTFMTTQCKRKTDF
jgi:hypothetical protein